MKLLVIGTDRRVLDPASRICQRQVSYYENWDVDILVLASGTSMDVTCSDRVIAHAVGGRSRVMIFIRSLFRARQIIRERHIEVVTAQDFGWSGMIAYFSTRGTKAKLHLQDHSAFFARKENSFAYREVRAWALSLAHRASRIRTVSLRGARALESAGIPKERIDIIPISIDVHRFASVEAAQDVEHILCVARCEKEKGLENLLQAFTEVLRDRPLARLRIVGDGSLRYVLEAQAKQLGIDMYVDFVGSYVDVASDLAWSSIVVQPSYFEGWGMAVAEAAAAGRCVVMTDVGCAGELIIEGESGFVVPVGDTSALAGALLYACADTEERHRRAMNAQSAAQKLMNPIEAVRRIRTSYENAVQSTV